jgi:hypothetical protein
LRLALVGRLLLDDPVNLAQLRGVRQRRQEQQHAQKQVSHGPALLHGWPAELIVTFPGATVKRAKKVRRAGPLPPQ